MNDQQQEKEADWEKAKRDLSFVPVVNPRAQVLTQPQIAQYNEQGYLKPFRIFDDEEAKRNRDYFDQILDTVMSGDDERDSYSANGLQAQCAGMYDIAVNPRILDLVEDLIGPDIVCWGTDLFCKMPHDPKRIPWHQDASYWSFPDPRTVTAWLAIDDVDEENAAMMFMPGTHQLGHIKWQEAEGASLFDLEIVDVGKYGEPVYDSLKAGEISLHTDMLAHGSEPNNSDRRRCGFTMRYCHVDARMGSGWNFNSILCRGNDPADYWADNPRPTGDDTSPVTRPEPESP